MRSVRPTISPSPDRRSHAGRTVRDGGRIRKRKRSQQRRSSCSRVQRHGDSRLPRLSLGVVDYIHTPVVGGLKTRVAVFVGVPQGRQAKRREEDCAARAASIASTQTHQGAL